MTKVQWVSHRVLAFKILWKPHDTGTKALAIIPAYQKHKIQPIWRIKVGKCAIGSIKLSLVPHPNPYFIASRGPFVKKTEKIQVSLQLLRSQNESIAHIHLPHFAYIRSSNTYKFNKKESVDWMKFKEKWTVL